MAGPATVVLLPLPVVGPVAFVRFTVSVRRSHPAMATSCGSNRGIFGPAEYWKPAPNCENDAVVCAVEFRLVRSVTVGATGFVFVVSAASSGDPGPPTPFGGSATV